MQPHNKIIPLISSLHLLSTNIIHCKLLGNWFIRTHTRSLVHRGRAGDTLYVIARPSAMYERIELSHLLMALALALIKPQHHHQQRRKGGRM